MFRTLLVTTALALGLFAPSASKGPSTLAGSWQVDSRHSDAQLITDGTTDFGKKKIDVTLGYGRLNGQVNLDDTDPTKSSVVFHIYPATSMSQPIEEDGNFKARWLMNQANQTLICFHSKKVERMADGKLQATGELSVTRVDRNIQVEPSEAYSGPVYGPPMIHRTAQEATFVFDLANEAGKDGAIMATASAKKYREDFPQLVRAVVATNWPVLVEDENCQTSGPTESYSGVKCTGTYLHSAGMPQNPATRASEDYPGPQDFNEIGGERLTILMRMRLSPRHAQTAAAAGE